MNKIKIREFKESNYRGIWFNDKTIRIQLDDTKSITELEYPEFYDVDVFGVGKGKCNGGCKYCYLSATPNGDYVKDAVEKIKFYFGNMTTNQRPFQIALPGSGEITLHPDFVEILKTFHKLDIIPNYTTNGMWSYENNLDIQKYFLENTEKYCGGVAVSCHPHLEKYWKRATELYSLYDIKLNFHIIISDKESIDYFRKIYETWKDKIDYFVLLPYGNQGRAKHKEIDWKYLVSQLPKDQRQLAFGANFYPYLLKDDHNIKVSLYIPELMSRFLDLKGNGALYNSSFDTKEPIKENLFSDYYKITELHRKTKLMLSHSTYGIPCLSKNDKLKY